jgi:hypothetical protein
MQLIEINKQRYRRQLNIVIVSIICALVVGSLGIAQLLIMLFPSVTGSHFLWNLLGVIVSCSILVVTLIKYKKHDFLTEVAYVWDLKMALNKVTRVMHKLEAPAEQGNADAMLALHFSYSGSRQLWQLDDNNITLDDLHIKQVKLAALAEKYNLKLNLCEYNSDLLKAF